MFTGTQKNIVYVLFYVISIFIIISVIFWQPYQGTGIPIIRTVIVFFASILLIKYFLYMMLSPWYDVYMAYKKRIFKKKTKKHAKEYRPLVSVIIPAWNEEVGLVTTVKSVLNNTYTRTEIIVVNDGSTDSSDRRMREFLEEIKKTDPEKHKRVRYFYKENEGKGVALNYGIEASKGDLIISIDADCLLDPLAVQKFVEYFEDPEVMAAVGNVKIGNKSHLLGTLQYLEFLFSFYFKKADSLINTIYIIGGAAGAFRREVFDVVGMYSSHNITEDIDLSVRIQEAGMRIIYAAEAIVYTEGATTFEGLFAQRLRWKRGRFQTFQEHRQFFFSQDKKHNFLLTCVILPFALFGDIQLFFELVFLVFLYFFSLFTHDFSSFISGIIIVSSMFFVQVIDDPDARGRIEMYALAPIGWLLFYITTIVEYRALIRSIRDMATNRKLRWQKWRRAGVLDQNVL